MTFNHHFVRSLKEGSMKKILCMLLVLLAVAPLVVFAGGQKDSGLIKVGIVNNPRPNPDTALRTLQTSKKYSPQITVMKFLPSIA